VKIKFYFNWAYKNKKKINKISLVKKNEKTIANYFFYNFFIQIFVTVLTFEHYIVNITARLLNI